MNLPLELDPQDSPLYAVVRIIRATGSRRIELLTGDLTRAEREAADEGGYVLEINRVADYR